MACRASTRSTRSPLPCLLPPSLLSLLRGERLGGWEAAIEVVEGVLRIEQFNALVRTEAYRLLGRAHHALGDGAAACEAGEKAVAEAARAKYAWLEMMALRDMLSWCAASEVEALRSRLGSDSPLGRELELPIGMLDMAGDWCT